VSSQGKWSSMGEHNRSHGSWCPQNGYKDGSGCDDFEICLELDLTKRLPRLQGHPTSKLVFLIGPHFFIALIDSPCAAP
jgi:hypothetical protein